MSETSMAPLAGVRVLALEQMVAVPYATQLLARLGADVIKVEAPGTGESGRASVPFVVDADGRRSGATYLRSNMNKRSVVIDLKRGADLVLRLAKHVDVVASNFKAGALDRMELGYEALAAANPKVIYLSLSGFGEGPSPYREWPAYAAVAEAMSGVYDWARQPGQRPVINPMGGIADIGSGLFATIGILAALRQRDITGRGQHIDLAMFDAMVAIADVVPGLWSLGARERIPGAILTTFAAADGDVVIQVGREHQFARLAEIVGAPEWLSDERLSTRSGWVSHLDEVIRPVVETWMAGRPKLEICHQLAAAGLACGPVNTATDVLDDPHLHAHDMLLNLTAADGTDYVVPNSPLRFSDSCAPEPQAAPSLGADTDQVLTDLAGLDPTELARLRADGIIG